MRRIAVGDVMTRRFVSCKPTDSLHDCAKKMAKERVDSLLLTDGVRLVGILTSRDVLWAVTKKQGLNLESINGLEIATKKLAVIKPSADISQALEKMKSLNFKILPVLSKGELIGVVTLKDILTIEPELFSEIGELMDVREEQMKKEKAGEEWPLEGMCENCGAFGDLLKVEGSLLCMDCREDMY